MHPYEVVRRPLITEKNAALQMHGKYAFEVAEGASKEEVKQAIEKAFKVTVTKVNVISMPGKGQMIRGRIVMNPSWKKAVVTLKPGDKIEIVEGV
jgi:large subunit ribosomal protein L23